MTDAGATEDEILRVQLMARVPGFQELLAQDPRTAQVDLDRYIQNATGETGLDRDTVLRLTGSISTWIPASRQYPRQYFARGIPIFTRVSKLSKSSWAAAPLETIRSRSS